MNTLLGIDLGTSSIKLILVNQEGVVIETVSKDYPLYTPYLGWAEQHGDDWLSSLRDGMKEMLVRHPEAGKTIKGIGITGQMHGIVAVDQQGNALTPAILWADRRCIEEVRELENQIPIESWLAITGNRPNVSFTLPKILWLRRHQPELYEKASYFLLPKDYIRYILTGVYATDVTDASATLMYDIANNQWSKRILQTFKIPETLLPKAYSSTSKVGDLTEQAAASLGISPGIPVICGAGDAEAQAIGNGIVSPDTWLCTIGTGGQMFTPVSNPIKDPQGRIHTLCHGAENTWHVMGATLSAGASLQWFTRHILHENGDLIYDHLMDLVSLSRVGSNGLLFHPYLFGERTPHMDDKAKGAFIGLSFHHTRADIVRSILEGVLFSLRESIEIIRTLGIASPQKICMTGGAAESLVWRQLAADIFGFPITRCKSRSGSAFGAVILAAVGIGWFQTVKEAAYSWVETSDTIIPDLIKHKQYNAFYTLYQNLYPILQQTYEELDHLKHQTSGL